MSPVVLPFDILGKVLCYVQADDRNDMLNSCALVCHTFFDIARELINRNVWVGWWTHEACKRRLDTSAAFARPKTELIRSFCIDGKGYAIPDPAEWLTSILLHDFTSLRELSLREMNFDGLSEIIQNRLEELVRSRSLHTLEFHSVQFPQSLLYGTKGIKHLTMINATFLEASSAPNELKGKPPVLHALTIYADRGWHQAPAGHPISRIMKWLLEGNRTIGLLPADLSELTGLSIRSGLLRSIMFQEDELNQVLQRCCATLKHVRFTASFEVNEAFDLHFECLEVLTALHIHFPVIRDDLLVWLAKTLRSLATSLSLCTVTLSFKCHHDATSIEPLNWKDFSSIMNGATGFLPLWHLELVFCQDQARGLVLDFGAGEKAVIQELRNCLPKFDQFVRVQEGKIYEWTFLKRRFSLEKYDCGL